MFLKFVVQWIAGGCAFYFILSLFSFLLSFFKFLFSFLSFVSRKFLAFAFFYCHFVLSWAFSEPHAVNRQWDAIGRFA